MVISGNVAIRPNISFKKQMAKAPTVTVGYGGVANMIYVEGVGSVAAGTISANSSEVISMATAVAQTTSLPWVFCGWVADTGW
jgi:hypothetical protein